MAAGEEHTPIIRNYQERKNVLDMYTDAELVRRYRLDRAGIEFVTDLVRRDLQATVEKAYSLTPEMKMVMTLRYLATGKMQQCTSDEFGISQSSVSRAVTQTLSAISAPQVIRRFIKFPTEPQEIYENEAAFYRIARFPGTAGVIDCTHVRIIAPKENEIDYVNRENYHSMNIQLVFDADYKIINLVSKWPGSVHDARILDESGLRTLFEKNYVKARCHLLGDSEYGCKPWLLTPYLNPQPGYEVNYNRAHRATHSLVGLGIGQLKRRFHVLNDEIRLSPGKTCQVVTCCAILHNICKQRNIAVPDDDGSAHDGCGDDDDDAECLHDNACDMSEDGIVYRRHMASQFFH